MSGLQIVASREWQLTKKNLWYDFIYVQIALILISTVFYYNRINIFDYHKLFVLKNINFRFFFINWKFNPLLFLPKFDLPEALFICVAVLLGSQFSQTNCGPLFHYFSLEFFTHGTQLTVGKWLTEYHRPFMAKKPPPERLVGKFSRDPAGHK